LCLTDGKLYIGGRYRQKGNKLVQIPMYSILKIEGRFVSKWAPMYFIFLFLAKYHH